MSPENKILILHIELASVESDEGEYASEVQPLTGWRGSVQTKSLPEAHATIPVPSVTAPVWKKLFAFSGLGLMISVGYMDPGNWTTDIAGGSQFGYSLLFVILLSNIAAILLQHLALKLGVAAERDLAQVRDVLVRALHSRLHLLTLSMYWAVWFCRVVVMSLPLTRASERCYGSQHTVCAAVGLSRCVPRVGLLHPVDPCRDWHRCL